MAILHDRGEQLVRDVAALETRGKPDRNIKRLETWWEAARPYADADSQPVAQATLYGGRMALRYTALVPAAMAVGFFLLIVYFKWIGGYRRILLSAEDSQTLAYSTGVGDDP